ncbi:ARF/SAR [Mycena floridula]|nr:ARF/SAR [Mycena floridula]
MCISASSLLSRLFGPRRIWITMLGPDNSGKTTAITALKLDKLDAKKSLQTVLYRGLSFEFWDYTGPYSFIPWRRWLKHEGLTGSHVIFMVDSADRERIDEVHDDIRWISDNIDLSERLFLVLANKQDLPSAMTVDEITDTLNLPKLKAKHWSIQASCAISGDGLHEGLEWFHQFIEKGIV